MSAPDIASDDAAELAPPPPRRARSLHMIDPRGDGSAAVRPFIGICAALEPASWSFWNQTAALVAETYLQAVADAGGRPLVLVPESVTTSDPGDLLDRIHGLLLIGGADVEPSLYGQARSARTERTVPARDRFELALVTAAFARDVPVLGICRGIQIMNIATGGTLDQHLVDSGFAEHRPAIGRLDHPTEHEVTLEPNSLLSAVASRCRVNSHHHQGVATVGAGGRVIARSVPDGVIEAIEWPARRYALGVQWHPEAMELRQVFTGLVDAARVTAQQATTRLRA